MTAPNTFRIAAAFQAEKDPQQDAVIAWLGSLPKDSRGGVKRSVMKYHLTRALLLYTQSGADILIDGFGMVALVALMPVITIQILGLIFKLKMQRSVPNDA